jgi:hypothetical protein
MQEPVTSWRTEEATLAAPAWVWPLLRNGLLQMYIKIDNSEGNFQKISTLFENLAQQAS